MVGGQVTEFYVSNDNAKQCNDRVPAIVTDLLDSTAVGSKNIEMILFGGAPSSPEIPARSAIAFPNAAL